MPSLVSQKVEDVLIVYFKDARILDEATIQPIGRELLALADGCEDRKLLLNFEEVKFMTSAMIGKIMSLNKKCKADEIDLKLCGICKEIMEIFTMLKLNKVLDMQKTEEKAMAAFQKKGFFG